MHRSFTAFAVAAALIGGLGTAPASAAVDRRQAAMDAAVQAGVPGMLTVATGWRGTSGVGDVHTGAKPDPSGRFRIASVSKVFTATLVLKLAGAGRIGLDDPVSRYLPGLLPYPEPITIRQLLQHTSGLPRDLAPQYTWKTLAELDTERFVHFDEAEAVHDSTVQPLLFKPGTSWSYSNTGFNVLAMLVEKITGEPFERVLAERVTGPLHLRDTFLARDFPFLPGAATHGYEQLYPAPQGLTDVTIYNYSRYFGAGDLVSSAADLNRFFHALLGGQVLPAAMLKQMKTTVPVLNPDGSPSVLSYGLGLMRLSLNKICDDGQDVWGHAGDLPGFTTWSMHDEQGNTQITTVGSQDTTSSLDATIKKQLVMVNEFCTPKAAPQLSQLVQAGI